MRKIFVLWLLLLSVVSLAQPYSVKQLGIEKGLSNNYVVSIAQDKQGFLWFATEEGLNKFDGTRFITYLKNEDLTRQGITGNELNCLLDDPQDSILWIGTQRAGLNAYDYVNNTFLCYRHDGENPESLISGSCSLAELSMPHSYHQYHRSEYAYSSYSAYSAGVHKPESTEYGSLPWQ